jgi:hypothetical protein
MKTLQQLTLAVGLLLMALTTTFAQRYRAADVAVSFGTGFAPAVSYSQLYGKKFKYGLGLRFTSYIAGQTDLITAPAKLTAGKESFAAFLEPKKITTQLDTLRLTNAQSNSLNLVIHLQYSIRPNIEVGFNIDAVGLSFGGKQSGTFIAKQTDAQGKINNNKIQTGSPTALNLLLVSDSDIGSLNSELYGRYWLNDKIGIRAGLGFQFVEYTTTQKLAFDNDRFRSKILQPMIAISYKF